MEQDFHKVHLMECLGLEVLVPTSARRDVVDRMIYEELCLGKTEPASKTQYQDFIQQVERASADGIILGCIEMTFPIKHTDLQTPLFDTTCRHAEAAVETALRPS